MNKKYFSKFLPVEGEIKGGELVFDTVNPDYRNELFECRIEGDFFYDDRGFKRNKAECKLVKLFLCSRDIQEGDKVSSLLVDDHSYFAVATKEHVKGKYNVTNNNEYFKVIGEISPDAVWVKERDQFDEGEVQLRYKNSVSAIIPEHWYNNLKKNDPDNAAGFSPFATIKCPICKTFH